MNSPDAARARLDDALERLAGRIKGAEQRFANGLRMVPEAAHQALKRDYAMLERERDDLAQRLHEAEARLAVLASDAGELSRRLDGAIARVDRLMGE